MVTLYNANKKGVLEQSSSYTVKQEVDTHVPPKAKPLFNAISVNGVTIPEQDILMEAQNHPAKNPGDALAQAARALIIRELLWQEANRLELVEDANASNADDPLRVDNAIDLLIDREVDVPQADEQDCLRFYSQNQQKFMSETLYEARHILLAVAPDDREARDSARQQAENLIAQLQGNMRLFADFAQKFSACPSASQGGNLGQLGIGSTVAEFDQALQKVKQPGLIPHPVETRYGFHIIDVANLVAGEQLPFDLVKERIAAWLEASSWSKAVSQYIAILAANADITGIDITAIDGPLVQ